MASTGPYNYYIYATSNYYNINGPTTGPLYVTTPNGAPVQPTMNIYATSQPGTIQITFSDVYDGTGGYTSTYTLQRSTDGQTWINLFMGLTYANANYGSYLDTNLTPYDSSPNATNTTYYYQLIAQNSQGYTSTRSTYS